MMVHKTTTHTYHRTFTEQELASALSLPAGARFYFDLRPYLDSGNEPPECPNLTEVALHVKWSVETTMAEEV